MGIKIYLDDERQTPEGWVRCFWASEVIELLQTHDVEVVSLDHDLGDDLRGTGYDVLLWIEEHVFCHQYEPPHLQIHSANPAGRQRMQAAIDRLNRQYSLNRFKR